MKSGDENIPRMLSCHPSYDYKLRRICVKETCTQGGTTVATLGCPLRLIEEPVELSIEVGSITLDDELNNCRDFVGDEPVDRLDLPAGEMEDDPEADPSGYLYFTKYWNEKCKGISYPEPNILRYISCRKLLEYYPFCKKLYFNHNYELVISTFSDQTSLEHLGVQDCVLTSLAGIEFLANLRKLSMWYCRTPRPLSDLFLLSDLPIEKLSIAGTSIAPGTFLELPRLETITISDKIGDTPSGHLDVLTDPRSRFPKLRKIKVIFSELEDYDSEEYMEALFKLLREKHPNAIINLEF